MYWKIAELTAYTEKFAEFTAYTEISAESTAYTEKIAELPAYTEQNSWVNSIYWKINRENNSVTRNMLQHESNKVYGGLRRVYWGFTEGVLSIKILYKSTAIKNFNT